MLKKQGLLALVLACVFLFGVKGVSAEKLEKYSLEIGPELFYFEYKEPGLMKNEGYIYGLKTAFTYRDGFMLGLEGLFSYGHVDYSSTSTGEGSGDKNAIVDIRGLIGYDFYLADSFVFNPYLGYGYRYLNNDSGGKFTTTGHWGYERESNYYYSPVGVNLIAGVSKNWRINTNAEYDYFWYGEQLSHLSDGDPYYQDVRNKQKKGYGARGSIEIQRKSKDSLFNFGPFVRYWNIKESKHAALVYAGTVIGEAWEPKNRTAEYGIRFTWRFLFYDFLSE